MRFDISATRVNLTKVGCADLAPRQNHLVPIHEMGKMAQTNS